MTTRPTRQEGGRAVRRHRRRHPGYSVHLFVVDYATGDVEREEAGRAGPRPVASRNATAGTCRAGRHGDIARFDRVEITRYGRRLRAAVTVIVVVSTSTGLVASDGCRSHERCRASNISSELSPSLRRGGGRAAPCRPEVYVY